MDFKYVCPWVVMQGDDGRSSFYPKVHQYHQTWRATDGRRNPALAGGVAIVEAFGVSAETHAAIVADAEIDELTEGSVGTLSQQRIGRTLADVATFEEALRERRGETNPNFKRVATTEEPTRDGAATGGAR